MVGIRKIKYFSFQKNTVVPPSSPAFDRLVFLAVNYVTVLNRI